MSFLYHHRTKKAIKWIWSVIAVVIILGMVLVYSGGFGV